MSLASLISHPANVTPRFEHYNDTRAATRDGNPSHRPEPESAFSAGSQLRTSRHRLDESQKEIGGTARETAFGGSGAVAESSMPARARPTTSDSSSMQSIGATEAEALGKRRGHRPPAVATQLVQHPPSRSTGANGPLMTPNDPPTRASIGTIPSVLVGGAMEAEYAAQISRDRDVPQMRARPSSAGQRPDSASEAVGPSSTQATSHPPQPPLVSSSTYYIRPGHPFAGGPYPHHHKAASFSAAETQGPRGSISAPVPSSLPRHLLNGHRSGADTTSSTLHRAPSPSGHPVLQTPYSMGLPGGGYPSALDRPHVERESDAGPQQGGFPPGAASKQAFLSFFSGFYDSLADSRALSNTLDSQVQRAGTLLQTLQSAESALEALVDQRVDACRRDWDSRWRHVDQRLRRLEDRANLGRFNAEGGLEDRLGRLEETFARRHSESDSAGEGSNRRSGSIVHGDPSRPDGRSLR